MKQIISLGELELLDSLWSNPIHKKWEDREYYTTVLNPKIIASVIKKLLIWFEEMTNLKLKTYNHSLILHRFYKDNFFAKHSDNTYRNEKNRAYVVGFHLNNEYEGGDYVLYDTNEIINKTPGVPYFFNSKIEHEITPIKSGVRKSALIFINHEDLSKSKMI